MNLKTVSTSPIGSARTTEASGSSASARSFFIRRVWQQPGADSKRWRGRICFHPRNAPMKHGFVFGCVLALVFTFDAGAGDCIKDARGNVVCGKGQCAADQYGAATDSYGKVQCLGGCEDATRQRCEAPR